MTTIRTQLGKALVTALRHETDEHLAKERHLALKWLFRDPLTRSGTHFKIVIQPDASGRWFATLAYGVLGYTASDYNALVRVPVSL